MNSNIKHLLLWVVLIAVAGLLIAVVRSGQTPKESELTLTQFQDEVSAGRVAKVSIPLSRWGTRRSTIC